MKTNIFFIEKWFYFFNPQPKLQNITKSRIVAIGKIEYKLELNATNQTVVLLI